MIQKEYLGKTKNGCDVYYEPETSHARTHFVHHPKLRALIEKTLPNIEAGGEIMRTDIDTGEEAGKTDLVTTTDKDDVAYALRVGRTIYSRFAKGRTPVPTSWITVDLRRVSETEYVLYTAFIGQLTPSFPGGDYLPEQSREFWSNHALVWGTQEIIPGSETTACPWD